MVDPAAFRQTTDRNIEMQRIRLLVFAGMALMALGFAASSASAAPKSTSALLLPMENFPVKFSSLPTDTTNNGIPNSVEGVSGSLTGEGVSIEGEILKATGGLYQAMFLNVKQGTSPCNSLGDPSGEILVGPYNFFLVHDLSEKEGGGILFEVGPIPVHAECAPALLEIKGNVLGLLKPVDTVVLWTGAKVSLECKFKSNEEGAGTPEETKYWTSLLSSELKAQLLINFGTGFKQGCVLIGAAGFELGIDVNKMIELMQ
jgi:hypothetical protein